MSLIHLAVEHLRCVERAELALSPRQNLIWGGNGSGKTTLLEAVFLLGRGRSFRTRNSAKLIQHGGTSLTVFGRTDGSSPLRIGIEVSRDGGTAGRIQGAPTTSLAELSQAFPVQVIEPGVHRLVEEGGHRRRRWMDWAVFHVEPGFVDQWVRYTRAVKQRNAALRQQPAEAGVWDPEVARLGEAIASARQRSLESLQPLWARTVRALCGLDVELHYARGWSQDLSLSDALKEGRSRDQARGLTHAGPHRGDVLLRLSGRPAREVLSRGQQKLVAIAMALAQLDLVRSLAPSVPTLLLDDPAAELDESHLGQFIAAVRRIDCQLIVTSLKPAADPFGRAERVFHVEQGSVRPV
ncbi:MAG TPA: DNA replication/repair protein RecF [Steroidobacteraceae bacterium]|nr:DNA replication/repair protein RecF [Steroidobacteraceae bacterium]